MNLTQDQLLVWQQVHQCQKVLVFQHVITSNKLTKQELTLLHAKFADFQQIFHIALWITTL